MTDDATRTTRRRALPPSAAPVAFLVGLVVAGMSLLLLGVLAAEGGTTPIPSRFSEFDNGTVIAGHLVPPYAPDPSVLEVSYAFPEGPGDVYLLHCADLERLREGRPLLDPLVREEGVRSGSFSRSMAGYLGYGTIYFRQGDAPAAPGAQPGAGAGSSAVGGDPLDVRASCVGAFVAFRWEGDPQANRPQVDIRVREVPLDSVPAALLFGLAGVGGAIALAAGLAWGRTGRAPPPRREDGAGTAETLYRLAVRSEAWLARTRRYVLISGPVGIFLWYPVLIPWTWRLGREGSGAAWMPWALAAATLLFLVGLTTLWAREFVRLDRELAAWREQLAELRRREETLLAELSA